MADPSDYAFAINARAYKLNAQEKALAGTVVKVHKFRTGRPVEVPEPALDFNGAFGNEYFVVGLRPSTAQEEAKIRPFGGKLVSRLLKPETLVDACESDGKTLRVIYVPSGAGRCYCVGRVTPGSLFLPGFPVREDKVFFFAQFREDFSKSKEARKKLWRAVREKELDRLRKERGGSEVAEAPCKVKPDVVEQDEEGVQEEDEEEKEEDEVGEEDEEDEEDEEEDEDEGSNEEDEDIEGSEEDEPKERSEEPEKQPAEDIESRKRKTMSDDIQIPSSANVKQPSSAKNGEDSNINKRQIMATPPGFSPHRARCKVPTALGYSNTHAEEIKPEMPAPSLSLFNGQQHAQEFTPTAVQCQETVVKVEPCPMINAIVLRKPEYLTTAGNATEYEWNMLMEELKVWLKNQSIPSDRTPD